MFHQFYDLSILTPAPYNPRRIDDESKQKLQESLRVLGPIKGVIVNARTNVLIAGHQRTNAMKANGLTHAPAFVLDDIGDADEIRFNQLHNSSDIEFEEVDLRVPASDTPGWADVKPSQITGEMRARNAGKRAEILRLLTKYGEWGNAVATQDGRIIISAAYAMCCKTLAMPLKVYYLPAELEEKAMDYFGRAYGKFSYEHLDKTTWAQSLAQMMRLREPTSESKTGESKGKSRTYELAVLPWLRTRPNRGKDVRILDFGAGQMDYVKKLRGLGYNIQGIEFYFREGHSIAISQVQRDISALVANVQRRGQFDLVVCDSVLNSVDSLQAESDVLTCLNAFCRPGGTIIWSGRSREFEECREFNLYKFTANQRLVQFYDEHGFTALYGAGVWRYQKFHTIQQVRELTNRFHGASETARIQDSDAKLMVPGGPTPSSGFSVTVQKSVKLSRIELEAAVRREFNLPLPGNRSYGRGDDIVQALNEYLD